MTKRYDDPIEVELAAESHPSSFIWRGRRYAVERLLKHWRVAGEAWDPDKKHDLECFRVEAAGGTYELRLDRLAGRKQPQWRLARVWD